MNIAIAPEVLSQVKVGDITRFAPSPSGYLHLGHYSAMFTHHIAAASGNKMLLRIDDIDSTNQTAFYRCHFSDLDFQISLMPSLCVIKASIQIAEMPFAICRNG